MVIAIREKADFFYFTKKRILIFKEWKMDWEGFLVFETHSSPEDCYVTGTQRKGDPLRSL